ncbi:mucin-5AC-like [Littorina saxatilis]|uniref:Peptidase M12B domain-containing protein n=1 Tax=Littorina saxatilis TaxID=31220 RepID=A0AAN9ARG7_9CAEN
MFSHELSFVASVASLALLTSCVVLSDAVRLESGKHVSRSRRQLATTANTVELLLVLDKQAYDKYLARNNNDVALARQEIERYFAGVVKETNERLAKLANGGFSLRVSLTSIISLTTTAESSATESNRIGNNVNSRNALLAFRNQAQALEPTNRHDYAVLVTGYDLKREDGTETDVRTFGGGVCSDQKRGLIENFCTERTSLALTRVISLALNAKYDGVANLCADAELVMSPVSEIPAASQRENPFAFSACSANEIRQYLNNEIATQCLRTQDVANPLNIAALTTTELGQQYNADVQCALRLGTGSTLCRSLYATLNYDATLCHDMRCSVPGSSNCQGILPFDGTTCGNQKWCQDGVCTSSASAPATASTTCPQGDAPPATTFSCSASACASATPVYRDYSCCQTCSAIPAATTTPVPVTQGVTNTPTMPNNPVPTTAKMVSVVGVTPAATTAKMVSVAGATSAATTMPMDPTPTTAKMVSVVGVTPAATTMPMDPTPTTAKMVSVVGATPAATTMPMDPTPTTAKMVSVVGVTPAATTMPMSTTGVTTATTIGPTMSIEGVTGGMPNNPVPTTTPGPTMSIAGVTGWMPNNPPATTTPSVTISVAVETTPNNV